MLSLVHLTTLMQRTEGLPAIRIGLIDGPVAVDHPDLAAPMIELGPVACRSTSGAACVHGTFVAGILGADRESAAPGLCPRCTLVARPVFHETTGGMPQTTCQELALALGEVLQAGVHIVNLSLALTDNATRQAGLLHDMIDWAAQKGALIVAASGNQGEINSTVLTRHPWVLPVVSCDGSGRPSPLSNLNISTARRGLMAPGESLRSLAGQGGVRVGSGTSFAAALVSGVAALLWSLFPGAPAQAIKGALLSQATARRGIVPPLLDAERAYQALANNI